jgi:hypothetical protein
VSDTVTTAPQTCRLPQLHRYAAARSWGFFLCPTQQEEPTPQTRRLYSCALLGYFLVNDHKITLRADCLSTVGRCLFFVPDTKNPLRVDCRQIIIFTSSSSNLTGRTTINTSCQSDLSGYTVLLSTGTLSRRPQPIRHLSSDIHIRLEYTSNNLQPSFTSYSYTVSFHHTWISDMTALSFNPHPLVTHQYLI